MNPTPTDPFTAAIEAFHNAPGNTTDGVRAACAAYLSALPRREPSDAEVERAARAILAAFMLTELWVQDDPPDLTAVDVDGEANLEDAARAALAILPALPTPDAAAGWIPVQIEGAPTDKLIDIWIDSGVRWCDCYYDSICDEWRTSRPSGRLVYVKARAVTHWRLPPAPPGAAP
jgi:hypothetical protein